MRLMMIVIAAAGLAFAFSTTASAADDAAAVAALFAEAGEHLKAQEGFKATLDLDYRLDYDGSTENLNTDYTIAFNRPTNVSVALENEAVQARFVSTGETVTTYISEFNGYTVEEKAIAPDEVIANSAYGILTHGMFLLAELVKEAPFTDLLDQVSNVQLVEENHVRFEHDGIQWDVWFSKQDGKLVLDRFLPDLTPMLAEANPEGSDASVALIYDFTEWTFEPVKEIVFAFEAPEGIEQVASFRPPSPADALLGNPAPDFTLAMLDGGEFKLAAKKSDAVLILDFWATWCGPCRQAMPILEKVANEFADQNVKLYAVNLQETAEQIKPFLEKEGLELNVVLDTEGNVSELYKVEGIPQTVIVGKDGTVQAVHVGVSPDLEDMLREELTKLVAGEKLAKN